jgi:SAM-dependent methyltransferase
MHKVIPVHPVNRFLSLFGLKLSRVDNNSKTITDHERKYQEDYERYYKIAQRNQRGFKTTRAYRYEVGNHPFRIQDLEFEFVAYHLYKKKPKTILDIGSYRHFVLGLLAYYEVTSVDVRDRKSLLENEKIITCNAKALEFDDGSFDAVVSMEALPHFGLCRYGDDFDLDADIKAFNEMVRVLKPGGLLIFSAAITGTHPSIAFNARRNYSHEMIRDFCDSLSCVEEKFINQQKRTFCSVDELTTDPNCFDYYTGCWQKPMERK